MASDGRSYVSGYFALKLDDINCGIIQKFEGGDITADVIKLPISHDYYVKKHLGGPKYGPFTVQLGLSMADPVRQWIDASLQMDFLRKSGELQVADFQRDIRTVTQFHDALVAEVGFPTCDATSKDPAFLTLKFAPEWVRVRKGSGKVENPVDVRQKLFHPANFRLIVDGMNTSHVSQVDGLTIKQTSEIDELGSDLDDEEREPGKIEFPNLKFQVTEAFADDWFAWHEDFVIRGINFEEKHKQGSLQYLSPNRQKTMLELTFSNLGVFKVAADPSENNSDKIRDVTVELYMENLTAKFNS